MRFAIFRRLFERLYPSSPERYKIPLLGLDTSGKTTLLYRLKTGEVATTSPTIGFQVETIQVPAGKGRIITMLCWDAGGCSRLSPFFYRPYTINSHALIWVIDSADPERLPESAQELKKHIQIITTDPEAPMSPQDLPILILAAKRDCSQAVPLRDIESQVADVLKESPYCLIGVSSQDADDTTLTEGFGWLLDRIEERRNRKPSEITPAPEIPNPSSPDALEAKLKDWLLRAENESLPEEILTRFETFSLPAWDHYHHILIAFLLLSIHGRQKGKDMIFEGLERYIANSEQTRGRTFHVTMTYFWIQMVHFGMARMPSPETNPATDTAGEYTLAAVARDEETEKQSFTQEESLNDRFVRFLFTNPHLADGNLWAEYYSKDVMMGPEAKAAMVLPDKQPLPSLVVTKEK